MHVAYTYEAGTLSLYVDGTLQGTTTYDLGATTVNPMDFLAGGVGTFVGAIDDIRIYSRALSPGEVELISRIP